MSNILKIIDQNFKNIRETSFSREPYINQSLGIYHLDCSSFLSLILKELSEAALIDIQSQFTNKIKAKDFFDIFQKINNFGEYKISKEKIENVESGDILIWRKVNPPKSGDTGHIIIIKNIIEVRSNYIKVTVFDCTKLKHDNDTRSENGGVGHGEMKILIKNKDVTGYVWSKENHKNKLTHILHIRLSKKNILNIEKSPI